MRIEPSSVAIATTAASLLVASTHAHVGVVSTTPSKVPATETASFACQFEALWSQETHPFLFPNTMAHFSPPVIAAHNAFYEMWSVGALASDGVEQVAEKGDASKLTTELEEDGYPDVIDFNVYPKGPLFVDQASSIQLPPILMAGSPENDEAMMYHYLSAITQVAPSPDWFTGFSRFRPVDAYTDTWFQEFVLETAPYDAGTDAGTTFTASNANLDPAQTITEFAISGHSSAVSTASTAVLSNKQADSDTTLQLFANADGTQVLPVARWTCKMVVEGEEDAATSTAPPEADKSLTDDESAATTPIFDSISVAIVGAASVMVLTW